MVRRRELSHPKAIFLIRLPVNPSTAISFMFAALALAHEARAAVPCMAASPTAKPALTQVHVRRDEIKPGRVLLGHNGARVEVKDSFAPVAASGPGAALAWHELVDWKKHEIATSHSPEAAVLYFDTDQQGKRYLCRIEKRAYTEAYSRRNSNVNRQALPGPADVAVFERHNLIYDASRRLGSVVDWRWDGARLARTATACFFHDRAGRYIGASSPDAASCTGSNPAEIVDRYVYSEEGKLIRKISIEERFTVRVGEIASTSAARIVVYDAQGAPIAEYVEDDAKRHYRRNLPGHAAPLDYQKIKPIGSPNAINLKALANEEVPTFWQFSSIPTAAVKGDGPLSEQKYVIASGDKRAISSTEQDQIWKALSKPNHDLRYEGQGVFLLVPKVGAPQWAACMDYRRITRDACP